MVLLEGVSKALNARLVDIGRAAVREITTAGNRIGTNPDHMPYVFWALATNTGLPSMGKKQYAAYLLMVDIMEETGTMPNWKSAFNVPNSIFADVGVDALATYMGRWAFSTMIPMVLHAYKDALLSQVKNVARATDGRVSPGDEFDFLRLLFRQVLTIKSSMFNNGGLLRRVVRALPI